ncbi:MAG: prolyl oligopeptidase family serine peptidase [Candidatus Pacebacteria bacterium]|nr:prolyl oligopeptidase family serine peptidase [Candidatus Paceibacterota bacterium]
MQNLEQKPTLDIKTQLEQLDGVSMVRKVMIDEEFLKHAKEKLFIDKAELVSNIEETSKRIDAYTYKYLSDGLSVRGYLWVPKNVKEHVPLVIFNRGGTGHFGEIGTLRGELMLHHGAIIARMGVIVVATEYRGGGYDSEGKDERGGGDLNDVTNLRETIRKLPIVEKGKNIVVGASRGGMMAYILASREPWVKGVVSIAGEADMFMTEKARPEMKQIYEESYGGSDEEKKKRSATHFYNDIPKDLPILMLHGDNDKRVSVEQTRKLYSLLKESSHNVKYIEYIGAGHSLKEVGDQMFSSVEEFIKNNT